MMPTGMDMLVASVLKAAGVDAERAKADLANYGRQLSDKITSLDASLVALRAEQQQIHATVVLLAEQLSQAATQAAVQAAMNDVARGGGTHATKRQ